MIFKRFLDLEHSLRYHLVTILEQKRWKQWRKIRQDRKQDEDKIVFGSNVLDKITVFVSCFVMVDKIK
jgi:hypothetical protein